MAILLIKISRSKDMPKESSRLFMSRLVCATIVLSSVTVISVIYLNWHSVLVREYEMSVALDGKAPWGKVGAESASDHAPTVLYRQVGESYCYTAFHLPSLRERLEREKKSHVTVEYNVFTTLGREGRYTLRSVDGIPLAKGNRILQDAQESGGQILLEGDEGLHCP